MEAGPTDAREKGDRELNAALEADPEEELHGLSVQNKRRAVIQEYEDEALSRPDPYAKISGFGSADFQRIFEHLGSAVLNELDSHPHTVEELREYEPEIRLLVKLRNSIETDLAFQTPGAAQQAAGFPQALKGKGLDTNVATGKRELLPKRWTPNARF